MRLYHKYYRQTNPARRQPLRGGRKAAQDELLRIINPLKIKKNPGRKPGGAIEALNLLGELNRYIDEGHEEFVPLRDIVSARIDGYISEDAAQYSVSEALRNLSATQVRIVREMIADAGGEITPKERREIDIEASSHPSVLRAKAKLEAAEDYEEAFRSAIRRGHIKDIEYIVGPERLAAMREQELGAKEEIGTESYQKADPKLWKKIEEELEAKYPNRFIPAKTESRKKEEFALLLRMAHKNTPESEKRNIRKRLQTALSNRWKTALIMAYEKAGGRELSSKEVKLRKAQRMKALGTPFPLGPGFFGLVLEPKAGESLFRWVLFDQSKYVYMRGESSTKNSASRDVAISYRILMNLIKLGDAAGWDSIPINDRRWLDDKRPELSSKIARMLLNNISPNKVSKSAAKWIVSAADIPKVEIKESEDVSKICKDMTIGETRIFGGPKNQYSIHVKKGSGGKFSFFVELPDGKRSNMYRTTCEDAVRRGHVIGGAMTGGLEVARVISNPQKLKKLHDSATKYFRKENPIGGPRMPRQVAEEADIRELTGMVGIPSDPHEAFRYGFYSGIIRGIDTCGVQNYFKRRRIRNTFQERLLSAAMETTARVTGTSVRPTSKSQTWPTQSSASRKSKKEDDISDIDAELEEILSKFS